MARRRIEDLDPERRRRAEAALAAARSPEARAREEKARERYRDRPGLDELVRRGEVDPAEMTTMGTLSATRRAVAALRAAREAKGLSLADVARASGIDPAALSRIEGGANSRPTLETLARYAAAVGLGLDLVVRDPSAPDPTRDADAIARLLDEEWGRWRERVVSRLAGSAR